MAARVLRACALQLLVASAINLVRRDNDDEQIGQVNKFGVTRYNKRQIRQVKNSKRDNWWPDGTHELRQGEDIQIKGAADLTDNISWGWHHPNGVWNTIPVGGPMIDSVMNIYLGADDAVRKFSPIGDLLWSYAPRGQMAAAPSLINETDGTILRLMEPEVTANSAEEEDALEAEEELRPDWASSKRIGKMQLIGTKVKVGDRLKVRPGMGYHADGVEYFRAGDKGKVVNITIENGEERAIIQWPRTGFESVAGLVTLSKRFLRLQRRRSTLQPMLVGSTTNGYVFALHRETGEEIWATKVCALTAGVKGNVRAHLGIVVLASNRCENHLCYRYRNQTNNLIAANTIVRAIDASDGTEVWNLTVHSPVWNFVPQFGRNYNRDVVYFSDIEAGAYCVDLLTGSVLWSKQGTLGIYTQAAGVYSAALNHFYTLGHKDYSGVGDACNPAGAPGILPGCQAGPGTPGYVKAFDSRNGNSVWETDVPYVPSNAVVGAMRFQKMHLRLVVTLGFACTANSHTEVWVIDPFGAPRLKFFGPALYSEDCAGEKDAADIRRITGGREKCYPSAWTRPAIDSEGDLYLGNQVGTIQRWSSPNDTPHDVRVVSTLYTGGAFQEQAIAFAPGMMAVATCSSLIVFQTYSGGDLFGQENWTLNQSTAIQNLYPAS